MDLCHGAYSPIHSSVCMFLHLCLALVTVSNCVNNILLSDVYKPVRFAYNAAVQRILTFIQVVYG